MNFPNRLELLLWAVLAFPKACEETKINFQVVRIKFLQASGWSLRAPSGHRRHLRAGSHLVAQVRSNVFTHYLYVWVVGEAEVLSVGH